jgi:hypothetical protein
MTEPLSPDRLTRMMHDAVQHVTVPADTLDRIHQGVRRHRAVRQAGAAALAVVALAGGGATVLVVASGGGPAGPRAAASKSGTAPLAAATPTSAVAEVADLAAPARIQPYLPPPSLSSVNGKNVGNGVAGTPQTGTPRTGTPTPAPNGLAASGLLVVVHLTQEHRVMS